MDGLIGLLQQHRKGITHQEISDSLRDMVAAVTDAQKGGKIVITFGMTALSVVLALRSFLESGSDQVDGIADEEAES